MISVNIYNLYYSTCHAWNLTQYYKTLYHTTQSHWDTCTLLLNAILKYYYSSWCSVALLHYSNIVILIPQVAEAEHQNSSWSKAENILWYNVQIPY